MFSHSAVKRPFFLLNLCLMLTLAVPSYAANSPQENRISQQTKPHLSTPGVLSGKNKRNPATSARKEANDTNGALYTIKPGDNVYKILMREYGLTSRQAAKFIEIVRRENNISNFRRLRIGQKISISILPRKSTTATLNVSRKAEQSNSDTNNKPVDQAPPNAQVLSLEKPTTPVLSASDITANVKQVWGELIPEQRDLKKTLSVNSDKISISLDPEKYPILNAMDGGRILVDLDGKISPSIKSIISETDPSLRMIPESAANPKRFLASLIDAGKFYSVEEDFVMEFGNDPKLTIHSDFRVERTAESLVNQDVILMNAGKIAFSSKLSEFLNKEGFKVYEPFALLKPHTFTPRNRLIQVASPAPLDIASSVLKALSINAEENTRLDIKDVDNSGISLSITPDRYFNYKGKNYSITYAKDNASQTTLNPILEARGIHPIILNKNDDFSQVSERILKSLGLSGTYGFHTLWPVEDSGFSIQMSGIMIDDAGASGESLFLTNREIDRIIREISVENGFIVQD